MERDFLPMGFSANGQVSAKTVFVGHGVVARAAFAGGLAERSATVSLNVDLATEQSPSRNVIAKLASGASESLPGALIIGAHYDHLGYGGESSLSEDSRAIHNGADDNASGVAGLLQIAGALARSTEPLARDVYFVAFAGEESGLLGSKYFVEAMPKEAAPIAMLNMDMIGRLRANHLSVIGTTTAKEWPVIAEDACSQGRVECGMGGDGYGPRDHSNLSDDASAVNAPEVLQWRMSFFA
ncbi:MAG: M20/M25/M40 family metallo-hydrolase [Myxococcales bacterium]|nr:M20/M25/M40 family metallo-hydrolase [Myxococcales bacterium]